MEQGGGGPEPTLGLGGVVFTLVGFVIGMAIFVLPGELAAQTGPGLFVSYLIAGAMALISCVVAAQLASILPMSGAGYIGISAVLSPFLGFMAVWLVMACMFVAVPVLGYGFAQYLDYFIPGLPRLPVALLSILFFGGTNLLGVRASVGIQVALVIVLLVILIVFGVGGIAHSDPALMTPLFPKGFGPILATSIPAYFSYAGFMVIVEIGGEIKDARRTIPLGLAFSFLIILGLYMLVSVSLPGLVPYGELAGLKAPLATAARVFLPGWGAGAIAFAALLAAATSINAYFMTQTRDIHALARDGLLPQALATVTRRGEPYGAVLLAIAISEAGCLLGATMEEYSIMVVLALMIIQGLISFTVLRAPGRLPEQYARAPFKLGRIGLPVACWAFALLSAGFAVVGVHESPKSTLVLLVIIAIGAGVYPLRRRQLARAGIDIGAVLSKDIAVVRDRP